jgi:hypothetical protein
MIKDMDGDSFLAAKVEQFGVQRGFTKQINGFSCFYGVRDSARVSLEGETVVTSRQSSIRIQIEIIQSKALCKRTYNKRRFWQLLEVDLVLLTWTPH